ncbi:MAG: PEP-CTERM sorting domain-containing protein [Pirellulales bacterium]|nr:PEP-CTERM sorting domain-containing protein [Pirellulales bacterium]
MRLIVFATCLAAGLFSAGSFVHAALFVGFEPPTYSVGGLNGQDSWTSAAATVQSSVVLAGTQSAANNVNNGIAERSVNGAGFADKTTVSFLERQSIVSQYSEFTLLNSNGGRYVQAGVQELFVPNSTVYWYSGGVLNQRNNGLSVVRDVTYTVTFALDFTAQTWMLSLDDGVTVQNSPVLAFNSPTTVAEAEGGLFRWQQHSGNFIDNLSIAPSPVPEPATTALLVTALMGVVATRAGRRTRLV